MTAILIQVRAAVNRISGIIEILDKEQILHWVFGCSGLSIMPNAPKL
jgi:hypothetical protein